MYSVYALLLLASYHHNYILLLCFVCDHELVCVLLDRSPAEAMNVIGFVLSTFLNGDAIRTKVSGHSGEGGRSSEVAIKGSSTV